MYAETIGWITTALFSVSYLPQIWKTWRTKHVNDISHFAWTIQFLGYSSGVLYAITIEQMPLLLGYLYGLTMTGVYLWLYRWCKACTKCGEQEGDHCDPFWYTASDRKHFAQCPLRHHDFVPRRED